MIIQRHTFSAFGAHFPTVKAHGLKFRLNEQHYCASSNYIKMGPDLFLAMLCTVRDA